MVLGVYGAGGLGREVFILASQINKVSSSWEKIVFIDDITQATTLYNNPIYSFNRFKDIFDIGNTEVIIALGEPIYREMLAKKVSEYGFKLATLIHPSVYIPEDTTIEEGCIIHANVSISSNIILNKNVLLQPMTVIGHDSIIEENTVISALASVAGNCKIGKTVFIAVSVPIKEKISIGNNTIVGMGAVVLNNIEDNVVAVGNPARALRKNDGIVFK